MAAYRYPDIPPVEWERRIAAAACRYRSGEIDAILLLVAFGDDLPLYREVMKRILLGVATPSMVVPFHHAPTRQT